jgi:hypothetical protein
MELVRRNDQREVQKTNGADFGTSELIRHSTVINGFPFPLPLSNCNQQEEFDDDR